jgi:transcriptional regulator with XRE-family HTH domain
MESGVLVARIRREAEMSLRALADAAGLATSTVHRIERGELRPTVETLRRIAQAAGVRVPLEPQTDYSASLVGLARSIRAVLADGDEHQVVRMAAELVHRFRSALAEERARMITGRPASTGSRQWDAFVAALSEWLAVGARMPTPSWAQADERFLPRGWWVTSMPSMRAWEFAGTPVSFQRRGVYLHRDSLENV